MAGIYSTKQKDTTKDINIYCSVIVIMHSTCSPAVNTAVTLVALAIREYVAIVCSRKALMGRFRRSDATPCPTRHERHIAKENSIISRFVRYFYCACIVATTNTSLVRRGEYIFTDRAVFEVFGAFPGFQQRRIALSCSSNETIRATDGNMASLFNRKAKPFKHEEDDEVQIKITAKKPTSTKRAIVDLLDDSSGDEIDVKKKLKCDDDVIDLSTDSVVDYKEQARAKVRALAESSKATRVEPIDIDSPSPEKADVANAKALLKQIGASKKNAAKKPVAQVVDDVDVEQYVVPKIAPSLPRAASTPLPSTINAAEYLSRLTGARSARISATPQATAEKPQCKLKTRLNGVHERKWKIAFDESFGKVLNADCCIL